MDERLKNFGESVKRAVEIIAGGSLVEFGKRLIESGAAMDRASIKANVNAEAFSQLTYAAKLSGVEMDALANDLLRMERNLSLAGTGAKAQADTLKALGLTYDDLKEKKPEEQFEVLADRISKLKDPSDKARAELALFGRAGGDLAVFMEKGAKGIQALRDEAVRMGNSFSKEQLENLEETHKAIDRMEASFTGLATTLIAKVSPALSDFFDQIATAISRDKINGLRNYIKLLQEEIERAEKSNSPTVQGTEGLTIEQAKQKVNSEMARLRTMTGVQTHSRGEISTDTAAPPGYDADTSGLNFVHISAKYDTSFQQWNEQMMRTLDRVNTEYNKTLATNEALLKSKVITAEEFSKRLDEAKQKYNDAIDISPVVISAKKQVDHFITDTLERIREFRGDFENALSGAVHSGGNFGKNFLKGLLQALEDRAIFKAISAIGTALENALANATNKPGGGILSSILANIFGGVGSSGGSSSASGPDYSGGGFGPPGGGVYGSFATGGSFNVGGSGGTDSQVVAFRATPGEHVSVGGGQGVVVNNYIDARGATTDLVAAFPTIMKQNNEQLKADIMDTISRKKQPFLR